MFFDDAPNKLCGLCGTSRAKIMKMKNRRTEKPCAVVLNMGNTSKIAVNSRKQRKKHRKIGAFLMLGKLSAVLKKSDYNLSRTIIRAYPSRFCPFHLSTSNLLGSFIDKPIPHILSLTAHSAKIQFSVVLSCFFKSSF